MPSNSDLLKIKLLLEGFVRGDNQSLSASSEIEELLESVFPNDDEIQDYITMFASYRPEGGEFLYDSAKMVQKSRQLLAIISEKYPSLDKQDK